MTTLATWKFTFTVPDDYTTQEVAGACEALDELFLGASLMISQQAEKINPQIKTTTEQ